jgi:hypothetical protein
MHGTVATDAPPIFIVTASNDGLGLAPHSIDLYNKWLSTKHDAELHMYARGDHGFGMRKQNLPTDNWIERFYDWLGVQGLLTKKAVDHALDIYEKKEFNMRMDKCFLIASFTRKIMIRIKSILYCFCFMEPEKEERIMRNN